MTPSDAEQFRYMLRTDPEGLGAEMSNEDVPFLLTVLETAMTLLLGRSAAA